MNIDYYRYRDSDIGMPMPKEIRLCSFCGHMEGSDTKHTHILFRDSGFRGNRKSKKASENWRYE